MTTTKLLAVPPLLTDHRWHLTVADAVVLANRGDAIWAITFTEAPNVTAWVSEAHAGGRVLARAIASEAQTTVSEVTCVSQPTNALPERIRLLAESVMLSWLSARSTNPWQAT
jgi:hypothetical protein